jgi:phage-related tail fiber protein
VTPQAPVAAVNTDAAPTTPAADTPQAVAAATDTPVDDTAALSSSVTELPINTVDPVPAVADAGVTVVDGPLPAQVTGPPQAAPTTVAVQEAVYKTDKVITDTSDPLAVQPLPPNPKDLPTLGNPQPPEAIFAAAASNS